MFEHRLRVPDDPPRYLAYAELAFAEWWRSAGVEVVVSEARLRHLDGAHADDVLDLRLRVMERDERSMTVETSMYRDEELLVVTELEYGFVSVTAR